MVTRASTIDSHELESTIHHDSYLIVPSYSEAMLMEPTNQVGNCCKGKFKDGRKKLKVKI